MTGERECFICEAGHWTIVRPEHFRIDLIAYEAIEAHHAALSAMRRRAEKYRKAGLKALKMAEYGEGCHGCIVQCGPYKGDDFKNLRKALTDLPPSHRKGDGEG